jgi:hypothetical protein
MATAFDRCARLLIPRLMDEFTLKDWQACAIVGNLAHECAGFTKLQEVSPLVHGSQGGYGWPQWTGPRRRAYEAWCKERRLSPASDEANLGYLLVELKGDYRHAIAKLKASRTFHDAVIAFELAYEAAGVKHYDSRQKWADKAIKLWRGEPHVPASVMFPAEPVQAHAAAMAAQQPPAAPTGSAPSPAVLTPLPKEPAMPVANPPTVAWYKSPVFTGAAVAFGGAALATFQAYKPGVPIAQQWDTLTAPLVASVGALLATWKRGVATAQPITLTDQTKA